jgi:parallel beta-helix repeat protein
VRNGIGLGTVSDARITNNAITDSGSDGIDVAMSRRIVLDHNRCTDSHPTPGAHPDCIQLWSHAVQPPTADIVLSNNEVIGDTQGFTAFNHTSPDATGKVVDDGGFDRITVENNHAKVSTYHGVTLYDCRHCIVRNNRAESLPNAQYPRSRAWIKTIRATDLTMCGNVAVDYPRDPGQQRCSADEAARHTTPTTP